MFSIKSSIKDFPKSSGKRFKVIVNSGGGLFGYIITNFMSYLNFDLCSKIDAIAGTSIGGILALAYSIKDDYKYINEVFKEKGSKIFEKKNLFYMLGGPRYKNDNLREMLNEFFGELKLSDINKTNVIITSTDFTLNQPRIFENINLREEHNYKLTDIALCTSAAPTYLNAQKINWNLCKDVENAPINEKILMLSAFEKDKLLKNSNMDKSSVIFDGGMLENIPIISTFATLHSEFGAEPKDIDMLVIGTGNFTHEEIFSIEEINNWSLLKVLNKLILPYVTDSNEQTSIFWGLQMGFNSFTFFNPVNIIGKFDDPNILNIIEESCLEHKNEFIKEVNEFLNK